MGILDDAIREHLELKRRAGADAADIARLQRTAFGDEAPHPAPAAVDEPVAAEHAPAEEPPAAPEPPAAVEPEPEPEPAAPAEEGEVDEPEETPDFLQETPEHERLWFEQKPPKDFDF